MRANPQITIVKGGATIPTSVPDVKVLIVSQKLASGTAISGALYEDVLSDKNYETLFGKKSMMAECLRAFNRANGGYTKVGAISLEDASGGTAAAGAVVFSGTSATEAGTITVNIGDSIRHSYEISIAVGETPTQIGDALVAAIIADTEIPLGTPVNTTGAVALLFAHKGTIGNGTYLEVIGSVAGITIALTAFTGGATDPTLTGLFTPIALRKYDITGENYIIDETKTLLNSRFSIGKRDLSGISIFSKQGSRADLLTFLDNYNEKTLCIHCNEAIGTSTYKGAAVKSFPSVIACTLMGIRAKMLTQDAPLNDIISTSFPNDLIGSVSKCSAPYFNTLIPTLDMVDLENEWLDSDIDDINEAGGFVIGNNTADNSLIFGDILTTYKTDVSGNIDTTFKFLNTVDEYNFATSYYFAALTIFFNQTRMTVDANVAGWNMVTKNDIEDKVLAIYRQISGMEFVNGRTIILCVGGEEAIVKIRKSLVITLAPATGEVSIQLALIPMAQVRKVVMVNTITWTI